LIAAPAPLATCCTTSPTAIVMPTPAGVCQCWRPRLHCAYRPTDNSVQFSTHRYCDNPLSVQGPGAGPIVIAASVFTAVLRIAEASPACV
jgi:hypothetical protein